jgi:hypothetical protein
MSQAPFCKSCQFLLQVVVDLQSLSRRAAERFEAHLSRFGYAIDPEAPRLIDRLCDCAHLV